MNEILQQVKSVPGVSGILVLDKVKSATFQLMPASYASEFIKALAFKLLELSKILDGPGKVELKYENGQALIYNLDEAVILILGKTDLNLSQLNLVLKSVFPAVEKRLKKTPPETEPVQHKTIENRYFPRTDLELLLSALNTIAERYKDVIGTYQVTQNLRKAKEKLLFGFPFLANIFVDNNGAVSFIKGKENIAEGKVKEGFAFWMSLMKTYSDKFNPVLKDVPLLEMVSPQKEKLSRLGFFETYDLVCQGQIS